MAANCLTPWNSTKTRGVEKQNTDEMVSKISFYKSDCVSNLYLEYENTEIKF